MVDSFEQSVAGDLSLPLPLKEQSPSVILEQIDTDSCAIGPTVNSVDSGTHGVNKKHGTYDNFLDLPFVKKPELGQASAVDVDFLQLHGCFELPSPAIMNEFIRLYFLYIHPIVPLQDEAEFWKSYLQPERNDKLSLLTLQAMSFAASAVSITFLIGKIHRQLSRR